MSLSHPIKMIINAPGVPPAEMIQMGRDHGAGRRACWCQEHALRLAAAGVDIIVAQGGEAGGIAAKSRRWCSSEVVRAWKAEGYDSRPRGGRIMTGEQMAACMAMGRRRLTGSVWLATSRARPARSSAKNGRGPLTRHGAPKDGPANIRAS